MQDQHRQSQPPQSVGQVRLLIYSGRPDPQWPLAADAAHELAKRMTGVVGGEPIHPPPPGGLGYRGFLVRMTVPVEGLPAEFLAYRRVVTVRPGPRAEHWRDTAGVEDYLLDEARRQNQGAALDALGVSRAR